MATSDEVGPEFCDHVLASGFAKHVKIQQEDSSMETIIDPILQQRRGDEKVQNLNMIPGITDHVATTQIFTRCPWTMMWSLSLVSRAWRQAFESRYVYDARGPPVKCAREGFLAVIHRHPVCRISVRDGDDDDVGSGREEYAISLYDTGRDAWNLLPDLPNGSGGRSVPFECAWAVLDGRLYVLGGEDGQGNARADVYMLDFAACRRVWQQCASMSRPRSRFACHALNGKIYAVGGSSIPRHKYSKEAEMYVPEQNLWSPIADMVHHHIYHSVVGLKGELYVQGGVTVHEMNPDGVTVIRDGIPNFAECYSPLTNEWKKIEKFDPTDLDLNFEFVLVVVEEQLYKLKPGLVIYVYDVPSNSWTEKDTYAYLPPGLNSLDGFDLHAATAVGGEVYVLISSSESCNHGDLNGGLGILKSKGFSGTDPFVVWEEVSCSRLFGLNFQLLHAFEL